MANFGRRDSREDLNAKLLRAAAVGSVNLVERVLGRGADPNVADTDHVTAFQKALEKGYFSVAMAYVLDDEYMSHGGISRKELL